MKIILLTDLHITKSSSPSNSPWVAHLCEFINCNFGESVYIFVLGDIINCGDENAFESANHIFDHIQQQLKYIDHHFFFLPGNHDYCNGNLDAFQRFVELHQSRKAAVFDFRTRKTWSISVGEINFIVTDSINDGKYNLPGMLDLTGVQCALTPGCKNILLLHHSIEFEDGGSHTGIANKTDAINFLKRNDITHVFHGHAHATRNIDLPDDIFHYGVGSMGVPLDELLNLPNEHDQFLEISANGTYVESITNWLYRGGEKRYLSTALYPQSTVYCKNRSSITPLTYTEPDNYINRYVLTREEACADSFSLSLHLDHKVSLKDALQLHPRTLIIADAGFGKSMEMRHLAYVISQENPYILPIHLSLNTYNDEPLLDYIYAYVPQYRGLNPSQFLIILDGYEELEKPQDFRRELKKLLSAYPDICICISVRSNFLPAASGVFQNFAIYQLLPLSQRDIVNTLHRHFINTDDFFSICLQKGLQHLLSNPFYLNELIALYLVKHTLPLPHELMQQIIDLRVAKDSEKFECVHSQPLEESKYELLLALTKLAFGMQLLKTTFFPESVYPQILPSKDERELIKLSSLIIKKPHGYEFSHNIFREYLVARHLYSTDTQNILSFVSIENGKYVNQHWFNVLGFLLQMNPAQSLVDWIYHTEPLLLTRLEGDRITDQMKLEILKSTLQEIIEKNIWFRSDICTEEQLALFCQSTQTLQLLLDNIARPSHIRSLSFCLNIISSFTEHLGMGATIVKVLTQCHENNNVPSPQKRIAITAIADMGLDTPEITAQIVSRYSSSEDSFERTGVYEYLYSTNQADDYVSILLGGIKKVSYLSHRGRLSSGTESYRLSECLMQVSSAAAIMEIFHWNSQNENRRYTFYYKDSILFNIREKAVQLFLHGYKPLFDSMIDYLLAACEHYSNKDIDYAIGFFVEANATTQAFQTILDSNCHHKDFILERFMAKDSAVLDFFCQQYTSDQLSDSKVFESFAVFWSNRKEIFSKCAPLIEAKTGRVLEPLKPVVGFADLEKADIQCFFDALFDRPTMIALLDKLLSILDNIEMTVGELSQTYLPLTQHPMGTHELHFAIIQLASDDMMVKDFLNIIPWDYFVHERIGHFLERPAEFSQLVISQYQRDFLHTRFCSMLSSLDYHSAYTENSESSYSLAGNLYFCMLMKKRMDFTVPQSYYIGLLEVPYHFFEDYDIEGKFQYLELNLSSKIIKQEVIRLLPGERRKDVLYDLLYACKRYRLNEGKDTAISYCKLDSVAIYKRKLALEYLFEVFGSQVIIDSIIPISDDSLFEAIVSTLLPSDAERISAEIIERYQKNKSKFLLRRMIELNLPEGLAEYISESRHVNKPFDASDGISHITDSISCIRTPSLIPFLCDAVRLLFSDGFVDVTFHSLYSSLYTAFHNCAKVSLSETLSALELIKEEAPGNLELIGFCNSTIDVVLKESKEQLIKEWTIPEVRSTLQTFY